LANALQQGACYEFHFGAGLLLNAAAVPTRQYLFCLPGQYRRQSVALRGAAQLNF
jgi:hypothetical protein